MNLSRLSLNLRFDKTTLLDPLLTFSRASSATRVNKTTGLIELVGPDVPRLEKDGLLIEDASTNYVPDSIAPNVAVLCTDIPPLLGDKIVRHQYSGSGDTNLGAAWVTAPAGPVVFSAWIWLRSDQNYTGFGQSMEAGGAQTTGWPLVVDYAKRDCWQRVAISGTSAGETFACVMRAQSACVFYSQCWQVESGSIATSYIPTYGVPATRAAEICYLLPQAPWFSADTGTLVCDTNTLGTNGNRAFEIGTGNFATALFIQYVPDGAVFYIFINGSLQVQTNLDKQPGSKLALAWKDGKASSLAQNGNMRDFGNFALPPIEMIAIGCTLNGVSQLNGHIRSLAILPHDVSDPLLAAMSEQT